MEVKSKESNSNWNIYILHGRTHEDFYTTTPLVGTTITV